MTVTLPGPFRPLRRVEYDQLVALGAFGRERIELVYGCLRSKDRIAPRHASAVDLLSLLFIRALGDRAHIRGQNPFAASDISEPEPDLLVAPLARYDRDHPAYAHLVIEVAESSLAFDRGTKLRLYAECGVPEYWVVDVVARHVEVYREPSAGTFRTKQIFERGQAVSLLSFPDVLVPVSEIMQ